MAFTPLDSGFLRSTLLHKGADVVAIWALILASKDKFDESDLMPEVCASLLRMSDDRAEAAFEILQQPDPHSRCQLEEGRRIIRAENGKWKIVSGEKYQYLITRAAANERQNRFARKKKAAAKNRCEAEPGCQGEVVGMLNGKAVCSKHSFDPGT